MFDRFVAYGMLENPSLAEFIANMGEDHLFLGQWNPDGINVLYTAKKKDPKIHFKSFKNNQSF
ncbi:hypothetical protein HX109_13620 [Galbibacter sp. BG1]|uniref:hypothetical protein n=1 Tax=Galbibacter sp. BG1 TaxID=1170699 RepID=UPI0015C019CB|nr:hypothetical protein [Galbibacter sp. BG1]QLE02547.1 hypothetical protein HX109_13620 [Galbibacter sp. BG1]